MILRTVFPPFAESKIQEIISLFVLDFIGSKHHFSGSYLGIILYCSKSWDSELVYILGSKSQI